MPLTGGICSVALTYPVGGRNHASVAALWVLEDDTAIAAQVRSIVEQHGRHPEARVGQTRLAEGVVRLVHGVDGVKQARSATAALFGTASVTAATLEELDQVRCMQKTMGMLGGAMRCVRLWSMCRCVRGVGDTFAVLPLHSTDVQGCSQLHGAQGESGCCHVHAHR